MDNFSDFKTDKLIQCRKDALDKASEMKTQLFNGKFLDLLAFYKGQWHYITTIKL